MSSVHGPVGPAGPAARLAPGTVLAVHALIAALDPLAEIELRRALCRGAFERGRRVGWREGYRQAGAELAVTWHAVADPVARGGATYAELLRRRWGPGGQEQFGDPCPGGYQGGHVPWEPASGGAE